MHHLQANSSSVLIAGSETTSSMLSGVTYLLLTNRDAYEKVAHEVRTSFNSESEITLTSVNRLTYMLACLNEAMRLYPPVPFGMPRFVPKGGAKVSGEFIPEDVSHCFTALFRFSELIIARDRGSRLALGNLPPPQTLD
jgi:hypothetical protein